MIWLTGDLHGGESAWDISASSFAEGQQGDIVICLGDLGGVWFHDYHTNEKHRRHVITSQSGWFRHLPKFRLGWDVLEIAKEIGYSISILTKAPSRKHAAWSEKVEWCANHLEEYIDGVTIAHDKGMVYGALLVDDWPEYVEAWLKHRPRGLVIMPANGHNISFSHPNVVRYDGSNLKEVRQRMQARFNAA